jgi:hypothetical protein
VGLDVCGDFFQFDREDSIILYVSIVSTRRGGGAEPIVHEESSLAMSLNSSPSSIGSDPLTCT